MCWRREKRPRVCLNHAPANTCFRETKREVTENVAEPNKQKHYITTWQTQEVMSWCEKQSILKFKKIPQTKVQVLESNSETLQSHLTNAHLTPNFTQNFQRFTSSLTNQVLIIISPYFINQSFSRPPLWCHDLLQIMFFILLSFLTVAKLLYQHKRL